MDMGLILYAAAVAVAVTSFLGCTWNVSRYPLSRRAQILGLIVVIIQSGLLACGLWAATNPFQHAWATAIALIYAGAYGFSMHAWLTDSSYSRLANGTTLALWCCAVLAQLLLYLSGIATSLMGLMLTVCVAAIVTATLYGGYLVGAVGFGDVKLVGALVLLAAIPGPERLILAAFGLCGFGLIYLVVTILPLRQGLQARVPFGPVMIAANWIALAPFFSAPWIANS